MLTKYIILIYLMLFLVLWSASEELSYSKDISTLVNKENFISEHIALEPEVRDAMLDMADIKPGDLYIDLGSGNGQFVEEAKKRGAKAYGVEIDKDLVNISIAKGLDIIFADMFELNYSKYDVITFWFTDEEGTKKLMQKLYTELKSGARVIMLHSSLTRYRDGVLLTSDEDRGIIDIPWRPIKEETVLGNRFHLYIR
jgi:SAM-dependent methyltransferase